MDCVNHPGLAATAYCQNCGKGMCAACVRRTPGGQVLCEPCSASWQAASVPYAAPGPGLPNPRVAAVLGVIPGVGAMYNGQFFKGFLHVIVFAVLVSMSDRFGIFGLFVAAWIFYQVFDAYHTAKARRDGDPLPDPLGLNEFTNWFHAGMQSDYRRTHVPPPSAGPGAAGSAAPAAGFVPPSAGVYPGPHSDPYRSGYQPPAYSPPPPYGAPSAGMPPAAGFAPGFPPPPIEGYAASPPLPPVPPVHWRRREPIAAIVLIAMGLLFLLGQISGRILQFTWPVLLIGLGVWLIVRRMKDSAPVPAPADAQTVVREEPLQDSQPGPNDGPSGGAQ